MIFPWNRYPYTKYTDINIDWILKKLQEVAPVTPDNPVTYDPQTPTPEQQQQARDNIGIAYPPAPVDSVNGQTGAVTVQTIPAGGSTGQVLEKVSGTDYDVTWTAPPSAPVSSVNGQTGAVVIPPVPAGGTAGQVLAKQSSTDYDTEWIAPPSAPVTSVNGQTGEVTVPPLPAGGSTHYILRKASGTNYDTEWVALPNNTFPWQFVGQANGGTGETVSLENLTITDLCIVFYDKVATAYKGVINLPMSVLINSGDSYYGGCPPTTGSPSCYVIMYNETYNRLEPDINTYIQVYYR